jgi:hypothetical protein
MDLPEKDMDSLKHRCHNPNRSEGCPREGHVRKRGTGERIHAGNGADRMTRERVGRPGEAAWSAGSWEAV